MIENIKLGLPNVAIVCAGFDEVVGSLETGSRGLLKYLSQSNNNSDAKVFEPLLNSKPPINPFFIVAGLVGVALLTAWKFNLFGSKDMKPAPNVSAEYTLTEYEDDLCFEALADSKLDELFRFLENASCEKLLAFLVQAKKYRFDSPLHLNKEYYDDPQRGYRICNDNKDKVIKHIEGLIAEKCTE